MNESQLERIEDKIDRLLDAQSNAHGRLVKLETQAGFIKAIVAFLLTLALTVGGWAVGFLKEGH